MSYLNYDLNLIRERRRKIRSYFMYVTTGLLLVVVIIKVIPDLSKGIKSYNKTTKTLHSCRFIEKVSYHRSHKRIRKTLVLTMTDNTEWYVKGVNKKSWDELQQPKYIGKNFKLYFLHEIKKVNYPVQIEIENKVIYDLNDSKFYEYMLLLLLLVMILYSLRTFNRSKIIKPYRVENEN